MRVTILRTLATTILAATLAATAVAQQAGDARIGERREAIEESVQTRSVRLERLGEGAIGKEGEDYLVVMDQIGRLELELLELFDEMVGLYEEANAAGTTAAEFNTFFEREFVTATPYIIELIQETETAVEAVAEEREALSARELLQLEDRIAGYQGRIDHYYHVLYEHAERLQKVDLDATQALDFLLEVLPERADELVGRLDVARAQVDSLAARVAQGVSDEATNLELRAARSKVNWTAGSLAETARLLEALGEPNAEYRQLLIEVTGLSQDIFDAEVAQGLLVSWAENALNWVAQNGVNAVLKLLVFLVIVYVARGLGAIAGRLARRGIAASGVHASEMLQSLLGTIVSRTILAFGILIGLSQLGIQVGPILAGIGIVGFAIGFALQQTLSNFAAGTMLLVYRPFDNGDVVTVGDTTGTVSDLSLVNTTLLTFDNRKIIVPNNHIWGDVIVNVSAMDNRRVDIAVRVAPYESVERVESLLREAVAEDPRVLDDPAPNIRVGKLDDDAVEYIVRPWALNEDHWDVLWDLNRAIKLKFEAAGIELASSRQRIELIGDSRQADA